MQHSAYHLGQIDANNCFFGAEAALKIDGLKHRGSPKNLVLSFFEQHENRNDFIEITDFVYSYDGGDLKKDYFKSCLNLSEQKFFSLLKKYRDAIK